MSQPDPTTIEAYRGLTKHPVGSVRELWRITYPLMLTALSGNLMLFLDRVILAHYDTDAMNGAVSAGMVCAMFQFGAIGIATIAEVFVGQFNGAGDKHRLGEPVWQMIWFSLLTLIIFAPVAFYGAPWLVPDSFHGNATLYFKWLMWAGPLFPMMTALASFFIGQGRVGVATWTAIFANILNLVLDILFIFGVKGLIPEMGTAGAAIATVGSAAAQVLILGALFLTPYCRKHQGTAHWRFQPRLFLNCLKIGAPNAVGHMIEIGAWAVLLHMVAEVSTDHITVMSIGMSIFILLGFATDGLQKGVVTVASNLIGADEKGKVPRALCSGVKLHLMICAVLVLPMLLFPGVLVDRFLAADPTLHAETLVHRSAVIALFWGWVYFIFDGLTWVFAGILTAGGDTVFIMVMNAVGVWLFAITPVYFIVVRQHTPPWSTWALMTTYTCINMVCFGWRYKCEKWAGRVLN